MPEDTTTCAPSSAPPSCAASATRSRLLMADQAFPHGDFAAVAKIGVLAGSVLAAALGAFVLVLSPRAVTPAAEGA